MAIGVCPPKRCRTVIENPFFLVWMDLDRIKSRSSTGFPPFLKEQMNNAPHSVILKRMMFGIWMEVYLPIFLSFFPVGGATGFLMKFPVCVFPDAGLGGVF